MRHPSCDHPVANATDDYSGVECCMCAGRTCPDVTADQFLAHLDFEVDLFGEAV